MAPEGDGQLGKVEDFVLDEVLDPRRDLLSGTASRSLAGTSSPGLLPEAPYRTIP